MPKGEELHTNRQESTKTETKRHADNQKGGKHMVTVKKWGNSLAVRIPSQFAKNLGLRHGSQIELELLADEIVIRPVQTKPTLDHLLAQTKGKTNPHLDFDFGVPEGKELI
ncbi:AbrB/MazE/SpoVT family DNA-binding domain-containing protein [Robertmurraya massiliosenegalensis]|uniref:AbrB/MazE/SpoVT family DNA-binding domain-containing protein n=1 Tax=Robertmurraya TaxID=2837507 RepID=UPI0039A4B533